jgi:hypothetical protein
MKITSKVTSAILATLILGASSVYAADMSKNKNIYTVQTGKTNVKIALSKNGVPFVVGHNARIIKLNGQYVIREGNGRYFTLPIAKLKAGTVIAAAPKHHPSRKFERAFHQRLQMKKAYVAGVKHGKNIARNQQDLNHSAMQHHNSRIR